MSDFDLASFGASPIEIEEFLGRYDLGELLGSGAAARVHAGRDRRSGHAVALKFCVQREPDLWERFLREGRLMQELNHPCVVTVHATGQVGDLPYIATELLSGGSLRQRLKCGGLPPSHAVRLAIDVFAGVQACHATGVVHRDLKPANVLLTIEDRAKIADLGVAKAWGSADPSLTGDGMLLGTPAYMAPEQLRGEPAGVASDIYACGLMLFEMLTGNLPHRSMNLVDLARGAGPGAAAAVRDLKGHAPEPLCALLEKLLAPRPADRPTSAEDVAHVLRRIARMAGWAANGTTQRVRPVSPTGRVRVPTSPVRRSPAALAMAASSPGRTTSRRLALPSMRSFRARSGQLLVPAVRTSVARALSGLEPRAIGALIALLAASAAMVRWMLIGH